MNSALLRVVNRALTHCFNQDEQEDDRRVQQLLA